MKKFVISLLFGILSAISPAAETTPPHAQWADLEIDLSELEKWGSKTYTFSMRKPNGGGTERLGSVSLSAKLENDVVILKDHYQITYKGEEFSMGITHRCKKDKFLSPLKIECDGEGSDEVVPFVAEVSNGKATVRRHDGHETVEELPEGTITTAAMSRLVTLIPRIPGRVFNYKYSLESDEMNLKKDYRIEVLPPETIAKGNHRILCSKFKVTGGGINPVYYWVNKEGVLQRIVMDERKVIELVENL